MAERNWNNEFNEIVDSRPSNDPLLVGFWELKLNGFTNAVNNERADILQTMYTPDQMRWEICRDYGLTNEEYQAIEKECKAEILAKKQLNGAA